MIGKTIIVYGIPAYGHTYSNLFLIERLRAEGFSIIYYSLEPFKVMVEASGCEYRTYPLEEGTIDFSDGKRLLRLYRLLLEHAVKMLPRLIEEAKKEEPVAVIFDSLAPWGRMIGEILDIPKFSFYSIVAIHGLFGKSFFSYATGFSREFFKGIRELPSAFRARRYLRKKYKITQLDFISVLMNKGDYNLMGYSKIFQPGGSGFGEKYLFLGPLSRCRSGQGGCSPQMLKEQVIYISLGTIFNDDRELFEAVIRCLGNKKIQVVMATNLNLEGEEKLPENFIVEPFLNQMEVLKNAVLFLSAGGVNSIHEAVYHGVPCLFYPKQGEQLVNAKRFEQLGFGLILKDPTQLERMIKRAVKLKHTWSKETRAELAKVTLDNALDIIKYEIRKEKRTGWKKY